MAKSTTLLPTRYEKAAGRTNDAARQIIEAQTKARNENIARLRQARLERDAIAAGEPPPEKPPAPVKTKARRKK